MKQMGKKRPKKSVLVGLIILILVTVGVFYYKDESRLKSVKVDDPGKYAETKLIDDKVCSDKIKALNLSFDLAERNEDQTPKTYELSCQPTASAIKAITGSEKVPVGFKVISTNLKPVGGSGDFACKKNGSSMKFTVTGSINGAYLEIIPQQSFDGSKKANGSTYKCMAKQERGYGYVMFSLEENVGGLQGGKANENPIDNSEVDLSDYDFGTQTDAKSDDENEKVDRITNKNTTTSTDYVQVNHTLQNDTADYENYNNKETSATFKQYKDAYLKMKETNPEKTFSATLAENEKSVSNIVDGTGKKVEKSTINLACNYSLSQYDVKEIIAHNFQDTYLNDNSGKLTSYYYDDYRGDANPVFNTTYFYASQTTEKSEPYKWHLNTGKNGEEGQAVTEVGQATCKRVCEEVVKVDYGPPIAVKAGMCFEYRVKVSSIVQCKSDTSGTTEPKAPEVCLPTPTCYSNAMKEEMKVAGPTEDFQACVESCDGGKYSEKCSNSCYNKVYGDKKDNKVNSTSTVNPTLLGATLATCKPGQYFRYGNKDSRVNWCDFKYQYQQDGTNWLLPASMVSSKEGREYLYARAGIYYGSTNYTWPTLSNSYQTTTRTSYRENGSAGILRGYYNNDQCHDTCSWVGSSCTGKYLYFDYGYYQKLCSKLGSQASNCTSQTKSPTYKELTGIDLKDKDGKDYVINNSKDLRKADTIYNKKIKQKVLEACEASTTCNQSESTYIIHFNYSLKGETEVVTVPPYSEPNKSTLKNKFSETIKAQGEILLSYGGCYADNNEGNRWYQSEWTFPGTWIRLKGNKVSFTEPSDKQSWAFQKGKVCLPPNMKNTNAKWAAQFIKATEAVNNPTYTSDWEFSKDAQDKVKTDPKHAFTSTKDNYEGYNIYAESNGFGHFNWNFSISCFWSMTDGSTTVDCVGDTCNENCGKDGVECTCNEKDGNCEKKNSDEGYTIRSFDSDDPVLEGVQKKELLTTERNTPFNWSHGAWMKYMKAGGYDIDPEVYLQELKENKDIFDDEPDLEVTLTSDNINQIRKYNKDHNKDGYSFEGQVTSAMGTGVTYYESPFIYDSQYMKLTGGQKQGFRGLRGYNNSSSR